MSFFDSEVVRSEMAKISELQEEIYGSVFKFSFMSKEEKIRHVDLLEDLLNTQQTLYTRLSLSDDPEAQEMKKKICHSTQLMGLPDGIDINVIFNNMTRMLKMMKEQIDKTSSDR
jgi:hypothetical protein